MKKLSRRLFIVALAIVMIAVLTGCGSTKDTGGSSSDSETPSDTEATTDGESGDASSGSGAVFGSKKGERLKALFVPKLIGIPFYDQGERGAIAGGEDFNMDIIFDGPTDADAVAQAKMIEDYISKGDLDVICVAPNDPAVLSPVLQKAREAGIMTMFFDSMANFEDVDMGVTACKIETIGKAYWDTLVKYMGDSGDYIIMTGGLNAQNLNEWIDAGLEYSKTAYPNLNLVTEKIPNEEQQQVAYEKTLEALKAYPDLKGIICMATPTSPGVAQALREAGKVGEIANIGMSTPLAIKDYLMDDSCSENIIWDCGRMCYANAFLARAFYDGVEIFDGIDPAEYSASKGVGEIQETIGLLEVNDKLITMGAPMYVTKENVDSYNF
jgi:simple sugar transport system substrate-binding protein/rhamnose transport system substrate-binding protein